MIAAFADASVSWQKNSPNPAWKNTAKVAKPCVASNVPPNKSRRSGQPKQVLLVVTTMPTITITRHERVRDPVTGF